MDYDKLSDRELDALVAERVFLKRFLFAGQHGPSAVMTAGYYSADGQGPAILSLPPYSSSVSYAWEVVQAFGGRRWLFSLSTLSGGLGWEAWLQDGDDGEEFAHESADAPRAICIAALKATETS